MNFSLKEFNPIFMKKRIYIVEDSEIIASIIKRVLESNPSFDIHMFSDTSSALKAVNDNSPDLIITDYYLDDKADSVNNGAYLANKVREGGHETIIFLLSGKADMTPELKEGNFNMILDKNDIDIIYNLEETVLKYLMI